MDARMRILALGAALLCGTQAHAASYVALDNLQLTAYDAGGAVDPGAVTIAGSDRVDTEIPVFWIPCCSPVGPGPWNSWSDGVVTGSTPFTSILSLGEIDLDGSPWGLDVAYIGNDPTTGQLGAQASASGGAPFQSYAAASSTGTFSLAPHATLVMTGEVRVADNDAIGSATATLGIDGGLQQTWIAPADRTVGLDLAVTNPGDFAITGTFGYSLFASSVPEPATRGLLFAGLAVIAALATRRRRAAR
jgi:hypothetical protein